MLNEAASITLSPIGFIKNSFTENRPAEEIRQHPSQIVMEPEFLPGLLGLERGLDILVLFYLHRIKPEDIQLQLHPRHDMERPITGVFNTRSQFRPNRIGATVVQVEWVEENVITVSGLDAQDGTPVIDIKSYAPYFDADTRSQQFEVRPVAALQEARASIDVIDREIIRLLSNRAGYVRQVVNFKQRAEDVRAPDRYAEVIRQRRQWAGEAGLNPDVIEAMYKLLVENFIEEELELIRQRESQNRGHRDA